jgi:hypothetical protein
VTSHAATTHHVEVTASAGCSMVSGRQYRSSPVRGTSTAAAPQLAWPHNIDAVARKREPL